VAHNRVHWGSFVNDNEPSVSIKDRAFLDQLINSSFSRTLLHAIIEFRTCHEMKLNLLHHIKSKCAKRKSETVVMKASLAISCDNTEYGSIDTRIIKTTCVCVYTLCSLIPQINISYLLIRLNQNGVIFLPFLLELKMVRSKRNTEKVLNIRIILLLWILS
jgi:hypothetical protein